LHYEVTSASGDGDSMWYTRYYDLEEIKELLQEYNNDYATGWEINADVPNVINWGIDQEWCMITDDINIFNESPDWIQMKIQY